MVTRQLAQLHFCYHISKVLNRNKFRATLIFDNIFCSYHLLLQSLLVLESQRSQAVKVILNFYHKKVWKLHYNNIIIQYLWCSKPSIEPLLGLIYLEGDFFNLAKEPESIILHNKLECEVACKSSSKWGWRSCSHRYKTISTCIWWINYTE